MLPPFPPWKLSTQWRLERSCALLSYHLQCLTQRPSTISSWYNYFSVIPLWMWELIIYHANLFEINENKVLNSFMAHAVLSHRHTKQIRKAPTRQEGERGCFKVDIWYFRTKIKAVLLKEKSQLCSTWWLLLYSLGFTLSFTGRAP